MHRVVNVVAAVAGILLLPSIVFAQATIAGVVRDASAAVLPGVTVEASSPALIEKTRTVVSDGTGQYRITDLPPGNYVLTFSLPGFSTVKRDGLVVSGSGVIPVNVELRVGAAAGNGHRLRRVAPGRHAVGAARSGAERRDAEHAAGDARLRLGAGRGPGAEHRRRGGGGRIHGADHAEHDVLHRAWRRQRRRPGDDQRPHVAAPFGGGGVSDVTYDIANAEEMQVLISGGLGEAETGGPSINIVPKSGGNQFRGAAFYSTSGDWATSNNVDDRLRGFGITQPPTLRTNWDASGSLGGPIKRDRLWFFANVRGWGNAAVVDGIFANRFAGDASHWDYAADPSIEARTAEERKIYAGRLTAQLTPRNRVTFSHDYQRRCGGSSLREGGEGCRQAGGDWVASGRTFGADTVSPETFPGYHDFPYNTTQLTYSAPISSRTLLEAGYSRFAYGYARFGMAAPDGLMDLIPVTEATSIYGRPKFSYRGVFDPLDFGFNDNDALQTAWRAALSYVTGAHNMKVGYQGYFSRCTTDACRTTRSCATRSTTSVPTNVSYFLSPRWDQHDRTQTFGLFAQDQWTVGRLTLQGGVRFDRAWSWAPAEGNGTTGTSRFNPQPISFDRTVSVRGYNDITPRVGLAYDVFGTGKTALKVNFGKYVEAATSDAIYSSNNPAARIVTRIGSGPAAARGWTDGNGNYVVDCDLLNPAGQNNLATGGDQCARRRRRRPEFRQRQPEHHDHQSGHSRRLGRAAVRLAVRRLRAARAPAAAVGRGRLQPALVGKLLRDRQHADDRRGLRDLLHRHSPAREPAGRRQHGVVRRDHAGGERAGRAELHDERDRLRRRAHGVLAGRGLHRDGTVGQRLHRAGRHQHRARRSQQL